MKLNEVEKVIMNVLEEKKSIYELAVWTRDHAQYLKWFCNYKNTDRVVNEVLKLAQLMREDETKEKVDEFRYLCVKAVIELETNCK